MIQGTTPLHKFDLPIDLNIIKSLSIIYSQHGDVVLKKNLEDCTTNENSVMVKLTQEETLLFNENTNVQLQVRVLTTTNEALASQIMRVPVYMILDKVVLE